MLTSMAGTLFKSSVAPTKVLWQQTIPALAAKKVAKYLKRPVRIERSLQKEMYLQTIGFSGLLKTFDLFIRMPQLSAGQLVEGLNERL